MKRNIDSKKAAGILLLAVLVTGFFFWRSANQSPAPTEAGSVPGHRHIKPGGPAIDPTNGAASSPAAGSSR